MKWKILRQCNWIFKDLISEIKTETIIILHSSGALLNGVPPKSARQRVQVGLMNQGA